MLVIGFVEKGKVMDKVKLFLKSRKKSYFISTSIYIAGFLIVILILGSPKHYVVPILSMILAYGFLEIVEYKRWKKDMY